MRSRRRIVLYSHDAVGIGHIRRNLLIAETLAGTTASANVLMIAGAREANAFPMPPGVDCLTLPALRKNGHGQYGPRHMALPTNDLVSLRSRAIAAAVAAFEPDVLIVDKLPRGVCGELEGTLQALRAAKGTRCLLGLRDVLDDPESIRREWRESDAERAILDHYDAIWIYGDPTVYDPVTEYGFSAAVAARVHYTGYLERSRPSPAHEVNRRDPNLLNLPPGRLFLCMVGGGEDGALVAESFARAKRPQGTNGVIVTGPFMPPEVGKRLHEYEKSDPQLRVFAFLPEPEWLLARAERIIAMGGYNTVCEVLSYEKRALIVPRVEPRTEQLIRAERLAALGLIDMLRPEEMSPDRLSEWLARDLGPPPRAHSLIRLNGLAHLPHLLDEVLGLRGDCVMPLVEPRLVEVEHAVG